MAVLSIHKEFKVESQDDIIKKASTDRQGDQGQSLGAVQSLKVMEMKTKQSKFKRWPVKYEENQGKWYVLRSHCE